MISYSYLVVATISLVALTVVATAMLMLHAAIIEARDQRQSESVEQGRQILISVLSGIRALSPEDVSYLCCMPRGIVISLVGEISKSVAGDDLETIEHLDRALALTASAEKMARSRLWWRRIAGIRTLSFIDSNSAIRSSLLSDRHPLVRAHAAEWSGQGASSAEIKLLISLLEDDNGLTRFSAKDSLIRLGSVSAQVVAESLYTAEGSLADSLLEVAGSVNDSRLIVGALRLSKASSSRTRSLAADLLGALGGSEAKATLDSLLSDESDVVRASAAWGLGRLGHWRSASSLAKRLEDPSWNVRRVAGTSLRSLGAPGLLLLRKGVSSSDSFASDMAQQVLDLHKLDERVSL